jgi:hypothetical protein
MIITGLLVCCVVGGGQVTSSVGPEPIKTQAALTARFELVRRLSFSAPAVSGSFALSGDGEQVYFTERAGQPQETDLMALDLGQGGVRLVMPLCGGSSHPAESNMCTLPDVYVGSLPGDARRLLIAQGVLPQPYAKVFVLDLVTGNRVTLQFGRSPRWALLKSNGVDAALGVSGNMQVSPSGKYVLARLHLVELLPYYAEENFGVFSLKTGKREFLYHVPVCVVGNHEEAGVSRAWWEASDVVVVKRWGGKEETVEAFSRDTSGTWEKTTPPSTAIPRERWCSARESGGDWAIVGQDREGRGGYFIAGDVLFGSRPGLIFVVEGATETVVLRVQGVFASDAEVEVVVLRPLAKPAVS